MRRLLISTLALLLLSGCVMSIPPSGLVECPRPVPPQYELLDSGNGTIHIGHPSNLGILSRNLNLKRKYEDDWLEQSKCYEKQVKKK